MKATAAEGRLELLTGLFGDAAESIEARAMVLVAREPARRSPDPDETDAWLIAYADHFRESDEPTLVTLRGVIDRHLAPEINGVHVLPFHRSSSDRGFSVVDYERVDDAFGDWDDVSALAGGHRLMADAVLNHVSAESPWFRAFLAAEPGCLTFRTVDPGADLSAVVRPRTLPLVTTFQGAEGPLYVWTTFSADQVDLDYRDPEVLLAALEVLLRYRRAGASVIRLDAIAFLWKLEGSPSINLPETHDLIELLRSWLDEIDTGLMIVTETNVPHAENVAYLGRAGRREAQAVYQFALPPLVLHSLSTGDPGALVDWAAGLDELPSGRTYLNFTSSHDGVGVRPVEGMLLPAEVAGLTGLCERAGGVVNMRRLPDGSDAPYELASTWFSLMLAIDPDPEAALARHLLSQAFVLALRGIPLLYTHVLFAFRERCRRISTQRRRTRPQPGRHPGGRPRPPARRCRFPSVAGACRNPGDAAPALEQRRVPSRRSADGQPLRLGGDRRAAGSIGLRRPRATERVDRRRRVRVQPGPSAELDLAGVSDSGR